MPLSSLHPSNCIILNITPGKGARVLNLYCETITFNVSEESEAYNRNIIFKKRSKKALKVASEDLRITGVRYLRNRISRI